METRSEQRERLGAKYAQLSKENQAEVYRLFPATCNGLLGNAAYFPSVGRNAGEVEALMHRLGKVK